MYNFNDAWSILNRVTGGDASLIDGFFQTNGTGNVFLLNPNGIIIGQNATINVSNLVLSTLDLDYRN